MKCERCQSNLKKVGVGLARCRACLRCAVCEAHLEAMHTREPTAGSQLCCVCVKLHHFAKTHGAADVHDAITRMVTGGFAPHPSAPRAIAGYEKRLGANPVSSYSDTSSAGGSPYSLT